MARSALFVDVPNIYYSCKKHHGYRINYDELFKRVQNHGELFRAFAYGLQQDKEANSFIAKLKYIGFECKWWQLETKKVGEKNEIIKRDLSVQITMDIVRIIDKLDTVIIATSNLDFIPCIEWIVEKGVQCIVYGIHLNQRIKEVCSKWYEIDESLFGIAIEKEKNEPAVATE